LNNYYVYYKVAGQDVERLRARVAALFSVIEKQTGVRGRWMRRRDDPTTYMEVYEGVKDGPTFEALMQAEGSKFGVPRRLEIFSPVERPS